MKIRNLSALNTRYWVGMLIASVVGTTLGDFVSTDLQLGFVKGLLPLTFILVVIFVAEWKTKVSTEAYYWAAIVLTRTMATNLADLATHSLKLDYAWLEVALFSFLMMIMLLPRPNMGSPTNQSAAIHGALTPLSKIGIRYWVMILIVSVIGTTLGDFISDNMGLGAEQASLVLGLILTIVLFVKTRLELLGSVAYWITLIIVRTTGTVLGDFLSGEEGLNLGFLGAAACTAFLLVCVLRLWTSDKIPDLRCDNAGEAIAISEAEQPKLS